MILGRGAFELLCLFLLHKLQEISPNEFQWKYYGYSYKFGQRCENFTLMCTNLTTETFPQCPIHEKPYPYDGYCSTLRIRNSRIFSVNTTVIPPWNIYELTLSNDHILLIAQDTFNDHSKLRKLNLEHNEITSIDFLESLINLQVLNLAYNKLDHINREILPSLRNLVELYLNDNILRSIDEQSFQNLGNLRHLQLSNNKLQVISTNMFRGLGNLISLYLQDNPINSIKPNAFLSLKHLAAFNLTGNDLNTLENNTFLGLGELMSLDLTCNKISILYPESFTGLMKLQKLILNNNLIKDVSLGTFKNFPHLNNLQLGNNYLSQFKTGSFSNLGQLEYLNLSHNSFSTLNETVLYPLRNLQLLDLNNNNFTYINYTSLLLHLPNLHFISINDNNWACQLLTHMLKTFRGRGVDYLFNATKRYTEENVDGIYCTDNIIDDKANLSKHNNSEPLNKADEIKLNNLFSLQIHYFNESNSLLNALKNSVDSLSLNIAKYNEQFENHKFNSREEIVIHNTSRYMTLEQFYQLIGNRSKITINDPIDPNSINNNLSSCSYIISVLILLACIIMCTLLVFMVYKNYFQKKTQNVNSRSEIELLNALS